MLVLGTSVTLGKVPIRSNMVPPPQNIPTRTNEARMIRAAFDPNTGYRFISPDFSQVELRLIESLKKHSTPFWCRIKHRWITTLWALSDRFHSVERVCRRCGKLEEKTTIRSKWRFLVQLKDPDRFIAYRRNDRTFRSVWDEWNAWE